MNVDYHVKSDSDSVSFEYKEYLREDIVSLV